MPESEVFPRTRLGRENADQTSTTTAKTTASGMFSLARALKGKAAVGLVSVPWHAFILSEWESSPTTKNKSKTFFRGEGEK